MAVARHDSMGIEELIGEIAADQFSIPDFQREFVWNAEDIRQLMRSLFNEYSIGSLLLWNLRDSTMQELLGCKSLLALQQASADSDGPQQAEEADKPPFTAPPITVLDGQQRLTAMYYAFFDHDLPLEGKPLRFFVDVEKFMSRKANEPVEDSAFVCREESQRARTDTSSSPEDATDASVLYDETQRHEFPLRLLSTGDWTEWLSQYQGFWRNKAGEYERRVTEHLSRADAYFQQAQEAEEAAPEEYAAYFKAREQARAVAQTAEQEAGKAEEAVRALTEKINEWKTDSRELTRWLDSSDNTAKNREWGTRRHKLEMQISDSAQELEELQRTASAARETATTRAEELRSLEATDPSKTTGNGRPDPDVLRIHAYDEQKSQNRYSALAREAEEYVANGRDFRNYVLRRLLGVYQIPVMELPEDISEVAVSETFQQINRRGTKLQPFELLNAAVSLQHISPRNMLNRVLPELLAEGLSSHRTRDDLIRMMFIRTHPESSYETEGDAYEDLVPGRLRRESKLIEPLIKSAADFESHWDSVQQSYQDGLRALRREAHYGKDKPDNPGHFVPFEGMIPVYCSLLTAAGESFTKQLRVGQWYWASVLTERYSSSIGDRRSWRIGSQDYREVRAWFEDDDAVPEAVKGIRDEFGFGLFVTANGQPRRRSTGFTQGVRNLMFTFAPRDWLDGEEIPRANVTEYEAVPLERCQEIGVGDAKARSVFNTMLVDQASEEDIQENLPNVYMPKFLQQRAYGFRYALLASHCISERAYEILLRNPFTSSDFDEFLRERQAEFLRRIAAEVFSGLGLEPPE